MQPELIYQKLLLKVNKGNTEFNIALDKPRAVLIINEVKNRWVESHIKDKDSILIDSLQEVVKTEEFLVGADKNTYMEYEIPFDFYEGILLSCEAQREKCKKTIYSREMKNQNQNILLFDSNLEPDFDFEWTFHQIISSTLRVFVKDFKINKVTFTYYSVIPEFDIEGYVDINGNPSTNKPIELSDQYVDQIINLAAEEYMRDFQSTTGLSIAQNRTSSQE